MKNKKNSIFLIVVPILCILIVALFAYDRYQTNQLAKKFKQDNQTVDTSKNNNQTSLENKLPTIYCVGDSTTIGTSKNTSYPKYLENSINTTITTFGDDSINSLALAIKFGVSEIYVNNFTIPAKSEETTITLLDKNGQAVNAILTSKTNIDKCTINNIEGSINYDTANNRLVFKRSKAGESSKINTLTKIEVTKPEINKDNILILFTGSYEESVQGSLAEYQKQIISAFNTDKYIVVSLTQDDRDATNNLLKTTHGDHYLDFKSYLLTSGLKDAGITETAQDKTNPANKNTPSSLLDDKINGNSKYNELLAKQLTDKMTKLGYLK